MVSHLFPSPPSPTSSSWSVLPPFLYSLDYFLLFSISMKSPSLKSHQKSFFAKDQRFSCDSNFLGCLLPSISGQIDPLYFCNHFWYFLQEEAFSTPHYLSYGICLWALYSFPCIKWGIYDDIQLLFLDLPWSYNPGSSIANLLSSFITSSITIL